MEKMGELVYDDVFDAGERNRGERVTESQHFSSRHAAAPARNHVPEHALLVEEVERIGAKPFREIALVDDTQ